MGNPAQNGDTMKVINDNYQVCDDCTPVLANGDYTHLDYHYDEPVASEVMARINQGMSEAGGDIELGNPNKDLDFSKRNCDCCGAGQYGRRTHFYVVKWDEGETIIHDDVMTVDVGGYDDNGVRRYIYDYHTWD
jgi:hypothetical protein